MSREEFKKAYIGIILTKTSAESPGMIMELINNAQKVDITSQTENAQGIQTDAEIHKGIGNDSFRIGSGYYRNFFSSPLWIGLFNG